MRLRRGVVAVGLLLFGLSGGPAHAAGLTPEKVFPDAKSFVNIDTAFSPNGWGIVGWTEQVTATKWQLEVATRPPGGDWSEPTPLGATEDHNTTSPHVAINDSGAAAVTWVAYVNGGGSPNVLYVSTRPAGGSFTQPESVSGQYSYGVGIDSAGNVDLLYRIEGAGPDNGAYVKTVAAGSPFAPATAHEFGNGCTAEAIATSPGGDAAVAFGCSGLDFAVRHNGTWTESYPFTNTYPNCPGSGNSTVHVLGGIAIDPAGVPAAIVQRTDSQHDCSGIGFDTYRNTIFLVTLSAGALAGGGTVAQGPTVAFFGSRADDVTSPRVGIGGGQVVASWIQADQSGAYHPMVRTYASNGAASPGAVEAVPGALQTNVAPLAVSSDGSALLAFTGFVDSTHLQPFLATRPPAGPPGAPVAAGPVTSNYGGAIAIDASASGDGLLAYTVGDATAIGVRARGWDATAPQLSNVSIPGTATAGTPVGFGAQASDIWGPVSFGWNFGDGSDSGASPSHSFAAAGPHAVTVTATDGAGNSSAQSGTVDVAPALAPGPPGGFGTPAAPVLSRLSLSARTFRVGAKSTAISAKTRKKKVPTGTTIRFQLDQAATVAIKIERALPGRKRGKRCVAPTKKLKRAKRCTRYVKAGTLTRRAAAGADKVAFSGRIGKKALKSGRYRMRLVATAANATGPAKSITFKIVR